ncbi:MAG: 4Fe-4S dicluster domain-containing protein [Candidatus Tantalella remota]|nr:4Fe-4S dicluster domain-containing protein [Candidatus Tantalella remota]
MRKNVLILTGIMLFVLIASVFLLRDSRVDPGACVVLPEMTLKEIANENSVPVKEILHILGHEDRSVWDISRNKPIASLGIRKEVVEEAIEHIKEERNPLRDSLKYILWGVLLGFVMLFVLKGKNIGRIRLVILLFVIIVFGVFLGATPNPMESIVKVFKLLNNMESNAVGIWISFIVFTLFSLLGAKFICSWGCQLGAVQESLFNIPLFKKKYSWKVPFAVSLGVRILVFVIFSILFFGLGTGITHGIKNYVVYHHANFFKIFEFHDIAKIALFCLPLFAIVSFFVFRPFCQFICPFGLYSWVLENFAANRIRINDNKCTLCQRCVKVCPTEAMKDILAKRRKYFLPDCWSCGKCLEECPTKAIEYK